MDNLLHSFLFTGNVNPLELGNTGKGGRRGTKKLFLQLHQSTCTNPYLNQTKGVYPLILNSIIFFISSPGPKAKAKISDQKLSVDFRCCCRRCSC